SPATSPNCSGHVARGNRASSTARTATATSHPTAADTGHTHREVVSDEKLEELPGLAIAAVGRAEGGSGAARGGEGEVNQPKSAARPTRGAGVSASRTGGAVELSVRNSSDSPGEPDGVQPRSRSMRTACPSTG